MEDNPSRKPTRLKKFDYSSVGAYFVTICTKNRAEILSQIVGGDVLDAPNNIKLLPHGMIAEKYIKQLNDYYNNIKVDSYVIMPDHIHVIIVFNKKTGGASPSPTLTDVVCAFKSLSARICKQKYGIEKLFQRSFADHVIRDREDYETRRKYIYENPIKRYYEEVKD